MSQSNNKISLNNNDPNHLKAIVYAIITFNIVFDLKLNITICNDDAVTAAVNAKSAADTYAAYVKDATADADHATYTAYYTASAAADAAADAAYAAIRSGENISSAVVDRVASAADATRSRANISPTADVDEVCKTINLSNIKDNVKKIVKDLLIAYYYLK